MSASASVSPDLVALAASPAALHGAPHLVDVAAVRLHDGHPIEHRSLPVLPRIPVEDELAARFGLDEERLRRADPAESVLEELLEWLGDAWLVVHDPALRARPLAFELARCGLPIPRAPLFDLATLARSALPGAAAAELPLLAAELAPEVDDPESALGAAAVTAAVLEHVLEDGTVEQVIARAGPPATLADLGPRTPQRGGRRVRTLERAAREEKSVTLIYGDESSHPARLPVTPKLVYQGREHGYLEAECGRTGTWKTYRLDRLHKVETAR